MEINSLELKLLLIIILLISIILFIYFYYTQKECIACNEEDKYNKDLLKKKIENLEKTIKYSNTDNVEVNRNVNFVPQIGSTSVLPVQNGIVENNMQSLNSLDRIYNPLRYPYKSDYYYDQNWYPSLSLPSQVVGCGSRNQPCLGGTQVPIYNPTTPRDVSGNNIAPVYISTRGPLGKPQQVGILYKVYGNENDTLPLYGRKKYPNQENYEYYTLLGSYGAKVPVVTQNKNFELGSNDVVFIKGRPDPYRVTIYESDFPQYIPYL